MLPYTVQEYSTTLLENKSTVSSEPVASLKKDGETRVIEIQELQQAVSGGCDSVSYMNL